MDRKLLRVLLVEDNDFDRLAFERLVRKNELPYECRIAGSIAEGRRSLNSDRYDVVLLDYMLGDGTGFDLLDVIPSDTPVIFVTGSGDEATAVQAIKSGAVDYLIKDPDGNYLTILPVTVDNAIRTKKLEEEVKRYQSRLEDMVEARTIQLREANEQLRGEILERKQAEERRRESEEKYRSYIENAPDGVFIVDDAGRYLEANKSACQITGHSKEEIAKLSIPDLLAEESLEVGLAHFKELMETGAVISDLWHKHKDGSKRCLTVSAVKLTETRALGFCKDITEQKNAGEKIRNALREKEALIQEIHHRVKNNMQIIASMLSLQSDHIANKKISAILKENELRVRSMALIHERLYLSKDMSSIDVADYIDGLAMHLMQAYNVDPRVLSFRADVEDIFFEIETAIPCGLIINELMVNALKYAFPAGRKGEITVDLHRNPDQTLTLTVSDNGIGLPEDMDMASEGTFGMQLVTILTEQLDGALQIERTGGTTFKITFGEQHYRKRL